MLGLSLPRIEPEEQHLGATRVGLEPGSKLGGVAKDVDFMNLYQTTAAAGAASPVGPATPALRSEGPRELSAGEGVVGSKYVEVGRGDPTARGGVQEKAMSIDGLE
jgi:hypothetical protein